MRTSSILMVACALALVGAGCGGDSTSADMGRDGMVSGDMSHGDTGTVDSGTDLGDVDTGVDLGVVDSGGDMTTSDGGGLCGNGALDTGETCDTGIAPGTADSCPLSCNDGDPCTTDAFTGTACTSACTHTALTASGTTADTCCPTGATAATDVDCGTPPAAYRITSLALISPHPVVNLGVCTDATDPPGLLGMSVNGQFASNVMDYSLNIVGVFRPLDESAATSPVDVHLDATCAAGSPDSCMPATTPTALSTVANNMMTGTCLAPSGGEVNPIGGPVYSPGANSVMGPCFVTDETTVTFALVGAAIPLQHARLAARYMGGPPATSLVSGVLTGFLSAQQAADISVTLPILGAMPLYTLLQTNGMPTMNSAGDSVPGGCDTGMHSDDRDMLSDGTVGFWFFLNFTAEPVTWSGP